MAIKTVRKRIYREVEPFEVRICPLQIGVTPIVSVSLLHIAYFIYQERFAEHIRAYAVVVVHSPAKVAVDAPNKRFILVVIAQRTFGIGIVRFRQSVRHIAVARQMVGYQRNLTIVVQVVGNVSLAH